MKLYHRTTSKIAFLILRSGFVDRRNRFTSDFGLDGVWFSDLPPNDIDRETDPVISVALKLSANALSAFERKSETNSREWLIPTKVVKEFMTAVKLAEHKTARSKADSNKGPSGPSAIGRTSVN